MKGDCGPSPSHPILWPRRKDIMSLGENLRRLRGEHHLSQEDLADKLKVSRQAVSKWEQDLALPDTNNLIQISRLFAISLDDLVNGALTENTEDSQESSPASEDSPEVEETQETTEEQEVQAFEKNPLFIALTSAISILCFLAFILVGALVEGGWTYSWIILLIIPVAVTLVESIRLKRMNVFAFPILIVAIYCFLGMLYHLWHPYWFLFLLIPLYYIIADPVDHLLHDKKKN